MIPNQNVVRLLVLLIAGLPALAGAGDGLSGREIVERSVRRHEQLVEFEAFTLILADVLDRREQRSGRRFLRKIGKKGFKALVIFDQPAGISGVAMKVHYEPGAQGGLWLHLPALGKRLKRLAGGNVHSAFMGTDFTMADLVPQQLDRYRYERQPDRTVEKIPFYIVDAHPVRQSGLRSSAVQFQRLFIAHDNLYTLRTDYFGHRGALQRRKTALALAQNEAGIWRPGRLRMENFRENHQSILIYNRRDFSEAAVPEAVFSSAWIINPPKPTGKESKKKQ